MMMGLGFLIMLAILLIPILLIAGLVYLLVKPNDQQKVTQPPAVTQRKASPNLESTCSNCGAGLQPEWTHCPQCGAPVG